MFKTRASRSTEPGMMRYNAGMKANSYKTNLQKLPHGAFSVEVPDLPGCVTWGENRKHAIIMAEEAIELWLEELAGTNQ